MQDQLDSSSKANKETNYKSNLTVKDLADLTTEISKKRDTNNDLYCHVLTEEGYKQFQKAISDYADHYKIR